MSASGPRQFLVFCQNKELPYIAGMQKVTASWLKTIDALKDVPEDQLQWMIDNSEHYTVSEGEYLIRPGGLLKGTHIVLEGEIKLCLIQNDQLREIARLEPRSISGYLPFSRGTTSNVTGEVLKDAQLMTLPTSCIREMISRHYELTEALVHIMTNRVRNFTSMQQQDEKMMALGKLSAGLAHELNNPAAAIVRGSASLKQHLKLVPENFKAVTSIRMEEKVIDLVNAKFFEVLERKEKPVLSLIQRTEKEDELTDWLEDHNVANSAEIAENFLENSFTCDDLREFKEFIPEVYLSPVFNWMNSNMVTERMVDDLQEASQRISELVTSIKLFTHMDQGKGKEYIDIHTGLRSTLTILHYKIKKGNVEVIEKFDETLPKVKAMPGELNQVWTNLIDNALDAMAANGKGKLEISTEREREFVKITITDNGPGIPEEIRSRIFDPFFTTKDIGKGTGLGLDMVARIVQQHRGSVKVQSEPGHTAFTVCFLIDG